MREWASYLTETTTMQPFLGRNVTSIRVAFSVLLILSSLLVVVCIAYIGWVRSLTPSGPGKMLQVVPFTEELNLGRTWEMFNTSYSRLDLFQLCGQIDVNLKSSLESPLWLYSWNSSINNVTLIRRKHTISIKNIISLSKT